MYTNGLTLTDEELLFLVSLIVGDVGHIHLIGLNRLVFDVCSVGLIDDDLRLAFVTPKSECGRVECQPMRWIQLEVLR